MDLKKSDEKINSFIITPLNRLSSYGMPGIWGSLYNQSTYPNTLRKSNIWIDTMLKIDATKIDATKVDATKIDGTKVDATTQTLCLVSKSVETQYKEDDISDSEWIVVKNKDV
jgi:hypothetical protein